MIGRSGENSGLPWSANARRSRGMRRTAIVVALAAGLCALCVLASPAFAAKEKPVFGKFKASTAGTVRGIGEAGEMALGPYHFEGCEKELHSVGSVVMGESETFFQEVRFSHCEAIRKTGAGLEEIVDASFTLVLEFHSNVSLKTDLSRVTFGATTRDSDTT